MGLGSYEANYKVNIYLPDENSQNVQMISEELSSNNCSFEIKDISHATSRVKFLMNSTNSPTLTLLECSKFTLIGEASVKFSVENCSPPILCRAVDTIPDASSVLCVHDINPD